MSRIRFLVADTLSGAYLGTLEPSAWSLQDTLATPSTGTLTLPVSQDPAAVARLADLTQPRIRWVAVQDDQGRFLWGGPIPHRPALAAGQITVPLVDWRSWFYKAPVRPNPDGSWHDYIVPTATPRDQGLVMTDLMALALNTTGAPRMVVDSAPTTGFSMTFTARQLDKTIGDYLQSIQEQANGSEWWTYVTWDGDETSGRLLPHVAVGWPERASRGLPIRCEYKAGKSGNASDFAWPESADVPTRVWATGAGDPPGTTWAVDEWPELVAGTEVAWETIISGSPSPSAAIVFQVASGEVDRSRGLEGTAEFELVDERLPIGDVMTGDRAHVILENPWVTAEVDAARIIDRTISGGRAQATKQRISVNLEDGSYPGVTDPGFPIVEGS